MLHVLQKVVTWHNQGVISMLRDLTSRPNLVNRSKNTDRNVAITVESPPSLDGTIS